MKLCMTWLMLLATCGAAELAFAELKGHPFGSGRHPTNQPPSISGEPATTAFEGQVYLFVPEASDPENDTLTFSVSGQPVWASFDPATGALQGIPGAANVGTNATVEISVSDKWSTVSLAPFTITVQGTDSVAIVGPENSPPVISGVPATSVDAGALYAFLPSATDVDGDTLTFAILNKPSWAVFSSATGELSGTPPEAAAGIYGDIEISVSDGTASSALPVFVIEVLAAPNSAPVISGTPPGSVTADTVYSFVPTASDADGDMLGFSITNKPAWATFSTVTGALSGTPPESAAGTYSSIEISVSDGEASAALPAFSIDVIAPENSAPIISGTPSGVVTVDQPYSFTPSASDPDGDPLSFSIAGKPSWATFSTSTGELSGTPGTADTGTYSDIVISASDGKASASLRAFAIEVEQLSMGSATLSWNPPTENTDGSALTDLAGYRVVYGTNSGALDQQLELMNPGLTSVVIENLASGTWYFAVKAVNSAMVESDLSGLATKSVP